MTIALASAGLAEDNLAFRLVLRSIGSASPSDAAAIAVGLNVSVPAAMEALYRAPSVLVDGLTEDIGRQMQSLLTELGCDVSLDPVSMPQNDPAPLFDIAVYVRDVSRFAVISQALGTFLGAEQKEASRLLSTPPGVVLGKVSQATIDALSDRLGSGVDVQASDPDTALYDIFLAPCDRAISARLLADLKRRGLTVLGEQGCIIAGIGKAEADAIWAAHARIKELRVINHDFLRFDLVLTGGTPTSAAQVALTDIAAIPPHIVPRLFDEMPITVLEAVSSAEMARAMEQLIATGLDIRADLVSFLHLGLDIIAAPKPQAVAEVLRAMGIDSSAADLRRLPFRLPYHLPELQARLVRNMLEGCGAEVDLIDPTETGAAS